ncbi:IPTL-CTERM sorting domain-containing protein [Brevundimonas staleyi]|uniref:IPTL-CTERM sorting domain-containing protein n=1 Tax=Brevundimonas staleyi TaxID=74326 RepID=A0ABW0FSE5_9CAUL
MGDDPAGPDAGGRGGGDPASAHGGLIAMKPFQTLGAVNGMRLLNRLCAAGLAALIMLGFAQAAAAQNLIANPSFETPTLTAGQTTTSVPGWTVNSSRPSGIAYNIPELTTSSGNQWLFFRREISQQTTTIIEAGQTYTLTGDFGVRTDRPFPALPQPASLELWAGGTAMNGAIPGGTFIGGTGVDVVAGQFTPGTFVWTVPPGSPFVGQLLSVRLTPSVGDEIAADNISLTTPSTVPTLSEWAMILLGLMLAGGAALAIQRRRMTV